MKINFLTLVFLLIGILIPVMLDDYLTEEREDYLIEIRDTMLLNRWRLKNEPTT